MVYIRTDGNQEIGSGHIMRCLAIAAAIRSRGEEVTFILADSNPIAILERNTYSYYVLNTNFKDMEGELSDLLSYLKESKAQNLLIDSYFVTSRYLIELTTFLNVSYLDDRNSFAYPVDNLINYNIYADEKFYNWKVKESESNTNFLLGCKYVPLRKEFQGITYQVKDRVRSILITTGGSDKYNIAGKLIDAIELGSQMDIDLHVVSGTFNQNHQRLLEKSKGNKKIFIHQNVVKMSELMQQCDIAVSAGGSTMYELSAIGVPTICFSFADNQRFLVESFKIKGLALYAGDYLILKNNLLNEIVKSIRNLLDNVELRRILNNNMRLLVDGNGADRIAENIIRN